MPKPWELTKKQAQAEGDRLRDELKAANRLAAPLLAEQLAKIEFKSEDPPQINERLRKHLESSAEMLKDPARRLEYFDRMRDLELLHNAGLDPDDEEGPPPDCGSEAAADKPPKE